ncbi:MAG: hypothetical protein AUK47_20280 [Deltaproteobacteria bacterium CG2_30_63_29]|nr:MAG: hypothetical protein AUK47_20280 [Deltaproteobacteria bacterium CG2_30_63_29]PIW01633.1 MAG: hypothetical protein COW42_04305 [Deltaproteobacteria bacterium CG17_big_fil_post_rev_8_21_14_2_50_63_7]PJB46897.1 MAG: hypothetical protein CO108_04840 [Deltaproteobacteria bacterium CG_4_9_14_3_um_filter_63_12]
MAEKPSTSVQFTPYEISLCLYDVERTRLWKEAIEDVVRPGDRVVDAGAGTGILGVFAALDGAEKVTSIELHPRFCKLIENLAARNGVADKIKVVHADATAVQLNHEIDLLICELLCTGQFFEPEVQVVNHLRQFFKPQAQVIPRRVESFVQLLDAQEELYGVQIDVDSRSMLLANDETVSTRARYDVIDLMSPDQAEQVDSTVRVLARKSQSADAVVITSRAFLTEGLVTERTRFLYNPEVIFLKEPIFIEKDHWYEVRLAYAYGADTLDAEITVKPCP